MKGLLIKDWEIAVSNIAVLLVSMLVIGFGLSFLMETTVLLAIAPTISTTAVFISITSDASSKWNMNVITMPVTRELVIREKYLMYLLLSLAGLAAALVPCLMIHLLRGNASLENMVVYSEVGLGAAFLAGSISLMLAYMFDPEKSQIVFMFSYLAATGVITGMILLLNTFLPVKEHLITSFGIVLCLSFVFILVSYRVTVRMYGKKDIS